MKNPKTKFKSSKFKLDKNQLIVGVVVAIITITIPILHNLWLTKTQTLISIKGNYYPINLPTTLFDAQDDYKMNTSPDYLEKKFPEIKNIRSESDSVSFSMYKYLNDLGINNIISDLKYIRGYWIFKIENKGSKKVSDISLFIPFDGYFELAKNETDKIVTGKFDKNIEIGEIKPSNVVTIKIWSDRSALIIDRKPYFSSLQDKPKVTFENGYKLVNFGKQ